MVRVEHRFPPLVEKLLTFENCWERKILISLMTLSGLITFQGRTLEYSPNTLDGLKMTKAEEIVVEYYLHLFILWNIFLIMQNF